MDAPRKRSRSDSGGHVATESNSYGRERDFHSRQTRPGEIVGDRGVRGMRFPCEPYIDCERPLLCARLYEEKLRRQKSYPVESELEGVKEDAETVPEPQPENDNDDDLFFSSNNINGDEVGDGAKDDETSPEVKEELTPQSKYMKYNHDYSLSYVQAFLNAHLDDEFFIEKYSPLEKFHYEERMNAIRKNEATIFIQQYKEMIVGKETGSTSNSGLILHSFEKLPMMTLEGVPSNVSNFSIESNITRSLVTPKDNVTLKIISSPVDPAVRKLKRSVYVVTDDDAMLDTLARRDDFEVTVQTGSNGANDQDDGGQSSRFYLRIKKIRGPIDDSLVEALTFGGSVVDIEEAAQLKSKLTTLSIMIARALDTKLKIEMNDGIDAMDDPDLEVVAAYLRRVHYFDITSSKQYKIWDILTGKGLPDSRAGVHMSVEKLSNFLNSSTSGESIANNQGDDVIQEMRSKEELVKKTWASENCVLAEDGQRARCSFRYCAKLFKSAAFLEKHLFKKHATELKREQLKIHDEYIMAEWEKDEERSCLPPLCIDCGPSIGFREVHVKGNSKNLHCEDPEPALKEKYDAEQERREQKRLEMVKANMVLDIDDMVEEKVELKFQDTAFPVKKKRKKKKKSL